MESKIIEGYNNYEITSDGRVFNFKKSKYLKPGLNNTGYLSVKLSMGGKQKTHAIHRLVAIHFLNKPYLKNTVNHKNSIKTDNRVENLEWVTTKENIRHAIYNGLNKPGEYTKIKVINTKTLEVFDSVHDASLTCKYSQSHLTSMLRGYYTKNKACVNRTKFIYLSEYKNILDIEI